MLLTLGTPGCYLSHENVTTFIDVPDGALDGGIDVGRDGGPRDGGPDAARDSGTDSPDAGPPCALLPDDRATTFCSVTTDGDLPAGTPFDLLVRWSSCACPAGRTCDVTVDGDVIDVRTLSCALDTECDDCSFEGICPVPALEERAYRLRVDGVDVFDARAAVQPRGGRSHARCYEVPAAPDPVLECVYAWEDPVGAATLCYRELEDVGTYVRFRFTETCRGCSDWTAGCSVELSGGRLVVRPRVQQCTCPTCGDCPDVCVPIDVECRSIALRDGAYPVELELEDGSRIDGGTLVVEDVTAPGPERCIDAL